MAHYTQHAPPVFTPLLPLRPQQEWQQKEPSVEQHGIDPPERGIDWWTFFTLCLVWMSLAASSAVLLYISHWSTSGKSLSGAAVTPDEISATILFTALPILIATILNEVLIESCWRRVAYLALGPRRQQRNNAYLAGRLRASNFGIFSFIQHAWKHKPAGAEWLAGLSYCLLRWGTAVSIASVQLAVSWKVNNSGTTYTAIKRHAWLLLPVVLHAICIFGSYVIWMQPPWRLFSKRYQAKGFIRKYQPYLRRIQGGTLVDAQTIANHLETPQDLTRTLKTGRQVGAKISGIWVGLLLMLAAPGLAWVLCRYSNFSSMLTVGEMRMVVHLIFLVQNVCYIFALDFAIWNVSLDGLCRTPAGKAKPGLHFLGYSSGTVLLCKALKIRRPIRASIFLALFWGQACLMRALTVFYAFCASVLSYGLKKDMMAFADPLFWYGWIVITAIIAVPPFLLWLLTESDAPVRPADGWVWATIAKSALRGEGFYGVRDHQACWAPDVDSFRQHDGARLW